MNVLVINAGSSSLKYQLLDTTSGEVFAKGNCERIGIDGSFVGHEERGGEKSKLEVALPDHKTAIKHVFEILDQAGFDTDKIEGIGHRVVQGGWYFPESKVVTDETLGWVREVAPLAPLHNYAEADVIEICRELFPSIGNVIVADTSFHYNIPEKAWRYALPRDVVDKLHIRKYPATSAPAPPSPRSRTATTWTPPWASPRSTASSWARAAARSTPPRSATSSARAATPSTRSTR